MLGIERLHKELLAVAEEIATAKAERVAIDKELARLTAQRAAAEEHLATLVKKHLDLVVSITRDVGADPPDEESDSSESDMAGQSASVGQSAQRPTRMRRILVMLRDNGPIHGRDIASILGEELKMVYSTLQDMKRRRGLIDGPVDGKWSISQKGLEELQVAIAA